MSLIKQYRQMHKDKSLYTGNTINIHKQSIKQGITINDCNSILDYGCGKGEQYSKEEVHNSHFFGILPSLYDPAVEEYSTLPSGKFDAVISTDVLEHIEKENIDDVLAEIYSLANKFVYLGICNIPAHAILPDGRNAHVTIESFDWWLDRMRTQNAMFDMVRIDHFRGLEAAWEIPAHEPTAIHGTWVKAPGEALLQAIVNQLPTVTLVAEDLGIITPEVDALRAAFNLPGMKILQFAFDGSPDNPYLPAAIPENSVVYTGTHDNDTTLGWFTSLSDEQKQPFYCYMQSDWALNPDQIEMPKALIDLALSSTACLAIIPMQDILHLGGECRMNTPGTTENNWQ